MIPLPLRLQDWRARRRDDVLVLLRLLLQSEGCAEGEEGRLWLWLWRRRVLLARRSCRLLLLFLLPGGRAATATLLQPVQQLVQPVQEERDGECEEEGGAGVSERVVHLRRHLLAGLVRAAAPVAASLAETGDTLRLDERLLLQQERQQH